MVEQLQGHSCTAFFGKWKVRWSSYTYGPHSEALLEEGGTFSGQRLGETPVKAHLSRWLTDFSAYTPPQNMAVIIRDVYLWIHYILKRFLSSTFDCQLYDKYETNKDTKSNYLWGSWREEKWHWALTLLHQFNRLAYSIAHILFSFVYGIVKRTFYCCNARKEFGSCNI